MLPQAQHQALPAVQLYLQNIGLDPCFLDSEHLRQRQEALANACIELKSIQGNFTIASITIEDTLSEVYHFSHSCNCDYPGVALPATQADFRTSGSATPPEALRESLFTDQHPGLRREFWTPQRAEAAFEAGCASVDRRVRDHSETTPRPFRDLSETAPR